MENNALTIFIIDDSHEDRRYLKRLLEEDPDHTYDFVEADEGELALQMCRSQIFDCVILDYNLPDLNGLEFISALPKKEGKVLFPLIMFTGQGDETIATEALKEGIQDYLVKENITQEGLIRAIQNAIEKVKMVRQIERQHQEILETSQQLKENEKNIQELNQTLTLQLKELERSNEELNEFASIASHDLQAPLRAILFHLQFLEEEYNDCFDSGAEEYLNTIKDAATRMQILIQDLLAYSRLGTQSKSWEAVDCSSILKIAMHDLSSMIEDHQATIVAENLPQVRGDEVQLTQLFQNLLENAIKYRSEAPPHIEISARQEKNTWLFSFKDNGIGMETQYFERIFKIFQRLHTLKEYPGTGIGLAICKKIVERHRGHIWAESQPGQGSTFCFTIPLLIE